MSSKRYTQPQARFFLTSHLLNTFQFTMKQHTVLYYDNSGQPTPLSYLYHATASRVLSSSLLITQPNPTSITEIDSAYCPQCLQFWDAATAFGSSRGVCGTTYTTNPDETPQQGAGCSNCPVCGAILVHSIQEGEGQGQGLECVYSCGYCHWSSTESQITESVKDLPSDQMQVEMERATNAIRVKLYQRWQEAIEGPDAKVLALKRAWEEKGKLEEAARRRMAVIATRGSGAKESGNMGSDVGLYMSGISLDIDRNKDEVWSVETMEKVMHSKRDKIENSIMKCMVAGEDMKLDSLSILDADTLDFSKDDSVLLSAKQNSVQDTISSKVRTSHECLLPEPVKLRARSIRRCLAEIEAGKPGILVKPKVNPLEGDSSLRYGHGQWWKKDSSAIHSVPKVQICSYGKDNDIMYAILLKIKNPTLGIIRLRLISKASGEDSSSGDATENANLILDATSMETTKAKIISPIAAQEMENFVQLDPVEDAFLELGKGHSHDPIEVINWDAQQILRDAQVKSGLKIVAKKEDSIWVQYLIEDQSQAANATQNYLSTPLIMEIELGNGSWESSLIKTKGDLEGNVDTVKFSILPVWKNVNSSPDRHEEL